MPVIYAPNQLPPNTCFYMDNYMGLGGRYADIFKIASPGSTCLGLYESFGACIHAAQGKSAAVVTTNVLAAFGARDVYDSSQTAVYIIPAPANYHALYFNIFPYLLSIATVENGQVVLNSTAVEDLMLKLGSLWTKKSGFLRNEQLYFDPAYVRSNLNKIELIRKGFSNQSSKDAFTRFVYADPFDQFDYVITNLLSKIQYFDYLRPPPGGIVINCGVDNGWELPFFISSMGMGSKVFNIDPTGKEKLSPYSKSFCDTPLCSTMLSFHKLALWDSCGELEFHGYSVGEVGSGSGKPVKNMVESITIDQFCEVNSVSTVDIIKMDLEGAEPRVIRGMQKTITKDRPQLAICVYHGKDQNLDIPYMMMTKLSQYNFYFDTYFVDTGESVLYCIPKEKDSRPQSLFVLQSVLNS